MRYLGILLLLVVLLVGVISRTMDHPANFTPIAAIAIVVAFYFSQKWTWLLPLGAMLISDLFIGFYTIEVMISVYLSFLLIWFLGRLARSTKTRFVLLPTSLMGSIMFFVMTNFAVWAFTPLYEKTLTGLYWSYVYAIPFFKWTLAGDLLYLIVFIAIIETARYKSTLGVKKLINC